MKQKEALKDKKKRLIKQIRGKCNNIGSADEKKYQHSNFFLCQKLKSMVFFIQLKPILDIVLFQSLQLPSAQPESPPLSL
jgi:hypothetical protein